MEERDWLVERFEEHRPRLRAVAYRMLGSLSEADDAVQEAWLRVSRANADEVVNLGPWLTTVVGRGARSPWGSTCRSRSWTAQTEPTRSTRRCSPTPLAWPCSSSSRR